MYFRESIHQAALDIINNWLSGAITDAEAIISFVNLILNNR